MKQLLDTMELCIYIIVQINLYYRIIFSFENSVVLMNLRSGPSSRFAPISGSDLLPSQLEHLPSRQLPAIGCSHLQDLAVATAFTKDQLENQGLG